MENGTSPEQALRELLAARPEDRVAEMCLERLQASGGSVALEFVFEFDTK